MSKRISSNAKAASVLVCISLLIGCAKNDPEAMVASAKQYLQKNDPQAAVIELKNALQKKNDFGEARFLLGKTLLEIGDLATAEKELRKALELNYSADLVVPQLAKVMLLQGQFKKVVDELRKSKLTAPQATAELQTLVGHAQLALGNRDAAAAAFKAANAASPEYAPAMLAEAQLKAMGGDLPGAATLVSAALAKLPELTEGWQLEGDIISAEGKLDDALAAYRW